MSIRIAILRGINVGGKRKILMSDLRGLFVNLGYTEVQTYIQSGNVIFDANDSKENEILSIELEQAILNKFGFEVPVIIRTKNELNEVIINNPFQNSNDEWIDQLHVTFLDKNPYKEKLDTINSVDYNPDEFKIVHNNTYILCSGKYHESKLSNNFFEKKLAVSATTRNWKTILAISKLIDNKPTQ